MLKKISLGLILVGLLNWTLADTSSPQNIQLSANQQTVDITLPANGTTGFQWFVTGYDHDLLSLDNYRYAPNSNTKLMGAPGKATFTFNIDPRFYDAPQLTTVQFSYQQPWSPSANGSTTSVTLSSTASQNDASSWQKYPSTDGTEVIIKNAAQEAGDPNWVSLPPTTSKS
jgi:inhibitor of cysteine peptidase